MVLVVKCDIKESLVGYCIETGIYSQLRCKATPSSGLMKLFPHLF